MEAFAEVILLPTSRVLWWCLPIMKNIDVKSFIIGALLTSTIFLGVAAAPSGTGTAKDASVWDDKQEWEIKRTQQDQSLSSVLWEKCRFGNAADSEPAHCRTGKM